MERSSHGIKLSQASATGLVRKALDRILERRLGRIACKSERDNGGTGIRTLGLDASYELGIHIGDHGLDHV